MGFFDFLTGGTKCVECQNIAVRKCSGCSRSFCKDCLTLQEPNTGGFYCWSEACAKKYDQVNASYTDQQRNKLDEEAKNLLSNSEIKEYITKYLNGKEHEFKATINHIVEREDILNPTSLKSPDTLFLDLEIPLRMRYEMSIDVDSQLQVEGLIKHIEELEHDTVMLKKMLTQKGINLNHYQLLFVMNYLIDQEFTDIIDPIITPAYNIISKKTTTDKKVIIKEFLILQDSKDGNEFSIKKLLEKFNLPCTEKEMLTLVDQCKDELELEEFEKNLGAKKKIRIDDNFDSLDGYQFESYAKNLFSLLGYKSIGTKLSNDQGADLIVSKNNIKTVIQCKHYKNPVSNKAIQEVVAAKNHYGCDQALVLCTSSFTNSAIELAKSNKVELWDREKLKQTIAEINKDIKKESRFHSEQTSNIISGNEGISIPASCPYCNHEFQLNTHQIPKKNNKVNISCPTCESGLNIHIPDKDYECEKCKLSFDTIIDKFNHEKSCKSDK